MAWNTEQAVAFVGVAANVLAAMEAQLGDFQDRIGSVAGIPEAVWRATVTTFFFSRTSLTRSTVSLVRPIRCACRRLDSNVGICDDGER